MFSGIVEATGKVLKSDWAEGVLRLQIERPSDFSDLCVGDSISVNGVCLTIEAFDPQQMQFAVGHETLKVLQVTPAGQNERPHLFAQPKLNLERSLRMGDRNHGHMVSGHAEGLGRVVQKENAGESLILTLELPSSAFSNILLKGSITLNGVSLTVNSLSTSRLSVCLIPETLKRTNLGLLEVGSVLSFETDWMTKLIRSQMSGFQAASIFAVNPEEFSQEYKNEK